MIQRTTLIAFVLTALITGGALYQAFHSSKKLNIEETLTEKIEVKGVEVTQVRTGVSKDFWIFDPDKGRLHHHIESPHSVLTAISRGDHVDLEEKMIGLKCYVQEKVEEEEGAFLQHIRFIQSEEGVYHYSYHTFDAAKVDVALLSLPGSTLAPPYDLEDAYLKGVAEKVSLSFSSKTPTFHAKKFKAHIRPEGELP